LVVDSADQSAAVIQQVLAGQSGPARDIVLANAGAAIYLAGLSETLINGVAQAGEIIDSGAAADKLAALVDFTSQLGER